MNQENIMSTGKVNMLEKINGDKRKQYETNLAGSTLK